MSGRMRGVWQPRVSGVPRERRLCVYYARGPGWYQVTRRTSGNPVIKGLINRPRGDDTFK